MPRMPTLTEVGIRRAKPREKPHKLFDEGGKALNVDPKGSQLQVLSGAAIGSVPGISMLRSS
jgi:hypothetical protein